MGETPSPHLYQYVGRNGKKFCSPSIQSDRQRHYNLTSWDFNTPQHAYITNINLGINSISHAVGVK